MPLTAVRADPARGFGLVEALVALVVVSVGLIGIAALHAHALGAARTALHRTAAVDLAADLADRMRGNGPAAAAYAGTGADRRCGAGGASCSPTEMAEHDVLLWRRLVRSSLPGGDAVVDVDGDAPPTVTIRVSWHEPNAGVLTHRVVVRVPAG
ncbi:MAG TPA: type IV pilus modification protein PilV [Gammaproteobacteria bacterium]